jgi:2-oxoglutarate ferredoxin oxidoreductase subunit alpha
MGMNEWLVEPLKWDESRRMDRGKVMTYEELEAGRDFGRYLDVDGDGIPFRTYPGVHPNRGGYFTRGTSRNPYARYSEEGSVYVDNVQRLLRKFETAKSLIPAPVLTRASQPTRDGVIYYGSTGPAMHEALGLFEAKGRRLDALRVRGFPFNAEVDDFLASHDRIFVVEQNRDAQLRTLLMAENGGDPDRLVPVLHFDGTPITARFIVSAISSLMDATQPPGSRPLREAAE